MGRSPTLRRDVDGLRGVAVGAVVAYHAFPDLAPGGFAGVDVFFVISGFLITGLVVDARDRGTFTFGDFYARRARRLLPALSLVLLCVLAAAWALLSPFTVLGIARHTLAGAAFVPNVLSWMDAGYFDQGADQKPLLHLWSLGVEEQFYLVWPALLLWTPRRALPRVTGLLALVSFALAVLRFDSHGSEVFYLLHTRLWEPALGGLLALAPARARPARAWIGWLGLVMVGASFAVSSRSAAWPGAATLLPTVGAALILGAGPDAWPNRVVLGSTPLVAIGLISYPLYLWHWPLLSFSSMLASDPAALEIRAGAVAAAVLLAAATWALVERPIRGRWATRRALVPGLVGALGGVAGASALLITGAFSPLSSAHGVDELRQAQLQDQLLSKQYQLNSCGFPEASALTERLCAHGGAPIGPGLVVLWGDSHAHTWTPAWVDFATESNLPLAVIATGGCPPLLGVRNGNDPALDDAECLELGFGETVINDLRKLHPERVVLTARWSMYANGWRQGGSLQPRTHFLTLAPTGPGTQTSSREALARELPATVRVLSTFTKVTIVKEMPQLNTGNTDSGHQGPFGYEPTLAEHREYTAFVDGLLDSLHAEFPDLLVVDPAARVCTPRCEAVQNGVWLYRDDNHVSATGARTLKDVVTAGM